MIHNLPDHDKFFHTLLIVFDDSGEERKSITEAWMEQVDLHPSNPAVVGNAGFYLSWFDFNQGQDLMERAQELAPQDSYWPHMLGQNCFSEMTGVTLSVEERQLFARKVVSHARRLSELDGGPVPGVVANSWMPPCLEILGDTVGDTSFIAKLEAFKK